MRVSDEKLVRCYVNWFFIEMLIVDVIASWTGDSHFSWWQLELFNLVRRKFRVIMFELLIEHVRHVMKIRN